MKKLNIFIATIAALTIAAPLSLAYASHDTTAQPDHNGDDFTFTLSGSAACQSDGSLKLMWTIDNTKTAWQTDPNPAMTTSAAAPVSTDSVTGVKIYSQVIDGSVPSITSLTVTGSWNTDVEDTDTEVATVTHAECPQIQAPTNVVNPAMIQTEGK